MLPILLAIASAALFGLGDFFGGLAGRRLTIPISLLLFQIGSAVLVVPGAIVLGTGPSDVDVFWGTMCGLILLAGVSLFIIAFRHGRMSEVSPVMAITVIVIPVLYRLGQGQMFPAELYLGVFLAIVAIVLINRNGQTDLVSGKRSRFPLAMLAACAAGMCFALFNIFIAQTALENSLWPLVVSSFVRTVIMLIWIGAVYLWRRERLVFDKRGSLDAVISGMSIGAATIFVLVALQRQGELAVVSTISAESPIVTVIAACLFLKERVFRLQGLGLAAGAASIALIAGS